MRFKHILLATTALVGVTGASYAANEAYTDQIGSNNTLSISQTPGDGNLAGTLPIGGDLDAITQNGDFNEGTILQSGDNNRIGVNTNGSVSQSGDDNVFTITQSTDGNSVGLVRQSSAADASRDKENILTILQNGGNANEVGVTIQANTGGGANTILATQTGAANEVKGRITQNGFENTATLSQVGDNNDVVDILQGETRGPDIFSTGNVASLTQNGNNNLLRVLSQFGDDNSANVSFFGNDNGRGVLTGVAAVATASDATQSGMGNTLGVLVTGNSNQFGLSQSGNFNAATGVVVTGDFNQLGVMQNGAENTLSLATIDGSSNIIGMTQTGDKNDFSLAVLGASNIIDFDQESNDRGNLITADVNGSSNELIVNQTVGASSNASSVASLDIDGNSNFLNVQQNSTRALGGPQKVNVTVNGNFNNNTGGGFTGDAATAAAAQSLTPGDLLQNKNGAEVTLNVTGNNNLFATFQSGNPGGTITGNVTGDSNQAVVAQTGQKHVATFTQNGSNNNVGISQ